MLRYAVHRIAWTIRHGPLVGLTATGGWQKYGDWQPQSIRENMRRRYGLDLPW